MTGSPLEGLCRGCGNVDDLLPAPGSDIPLCLGCRHPLAPADGSLIAALGDALEAAFADVDYGAADITISNAAGDVTYRGPLAGAPIGVDDHVVDLFAGPGGWDQGMAEHLGMSNVTGVEVDPWAVATRRAAGHRTRPGDVAALDPAEVAGTAEVAGLIASPPCQLYSNAGSKRGRQALTLLADAVAPMLAGDDVRAEVVDRVTDLLDDAPADDAPLALAFDNVDTAERAAARAEARSAALVLEPARWIAALDPRWVVLEQVPSVLPLWQVYADALRSAGWSAEAAVVNAADYGAPQTRRRAVLIANRDEPVAIPTPTHDVDAAHGRAPWVPMAAALGWGLTARPSTTVMTARVDTGGGGPTRALDGGAGARQVYAEAQEAGPDRWAPGGTVGFPRRADRGDDATVTLDGVDYRARDLHPTEGPAPTVTEKARSWRLRPGTYATPKPGETEPRGNRRDHPVDEPAPTIAFGNDAAAWRWIPDGLEVDDGEEVVLNTGRDWKAGGTLDDAQAIPLTAPAPTIGGVSSQFQWRTRRNDQTDAVAAGEVDPDWPLTRPATTVAGRGLVTDPGANANRHNGALKSRNDGVRVEVAEAGVLQTFPADYPWQGPSSEQYQQVGNAVPPRLAAHLVAAAAHLPPPTFPTPETARHA